MDLVRPDAKPASYRSLNGSTKAGQLHHRSHLSDTIDVALRGTAVKSKAPASKSRIAPQIASALPRELRTAGLVRDVTRRWRFRAFAA
jgi:hypothetical protein